MTTNSNDSEHWNHNHNGRMLHVEKQLWIERQLLVKYLEWREYRCEVRIGTSCESWQSLLESALKGEEKANVHPDKCFHLKHLKLYTHIDISDSLGVPLFFSSFSIRIQCTERKYYGYGNAVDRPVRGVESRFGCSPLLYYEYRSVSKFRNYNLSIYWERIMSPSFKDTK
jgi:hypothetical protein